MNKYLKSPISIQVELTEACNNKCQHCYNFFRYGKSNSKPLNMKGSYWIADNIIRNEVFHVTLTGGEPLLIGTKNLADLIAHYQKGEVLVSLNTNFSLLDDYLADFLAENEVDVLTSIPHYNENKFNQIVSSQNYKATINSIRNFTERGGRVYANMVVTKETVKDVYRVGEFVAGLGCAGFCATRITPVNLKEAEYQKKIVLDNEDIISLLDQLLQLEKEGNIGVSALNPLPFCAVPNPSKYESLLGSRACCAGLTAAGVGIDGSFRGCQHLPQSYGTLLKEELSEIWTRITPWREEYQNSKCFGCVENQRCGGGCRENALVMTGNMDGEDNLSQNGFGPLREPVVQPKQDQINYIRLKDNILLRDESFGGVLYINPHAHALVDQFVFNLIPFFVDEIISLDGWLQIGKNLKFVDTKYLNQVFNDLVNKRLAVKIN